MIEVKEVEHLLEPWQTSLGQYSFFGLIRLFIGFDFAFDIEVSIVLITPAIDDAHVLG